MFCNKLGQVIVSREINEPPGEFWLATSTLHAASFPVVYRDVEVPTYLDVAAGFVANLC